MWPSRLCQRSSLVLEHEPDAVRAAVLELVYRRCAILMMGVHLLDNFELEGLGHRWEPEGRGAFLLTVGHVVRRGRAPSV